MNKQKLNDQRFMDLLFSEDREIQEKSSHISCSEFITTLYENEKVVAERSITEAGVDYVFYGE